MGRVIHTEGPGKVRNNQIKAILFAIRELMGQSKPDDSTKDLVAFIGLALIEIYESIETSVAAWEKRGYWLKADRYRLEWEWTGNLGREICADLLVDDWARIALNTATVAQKFGQVKLPKSNRIGSPWKGCLEKLVTSGY